MSLTWKRILLQILFGAATLWFIRSYLYKVEIFQTSEVKERRFKEGMKKNVVCKNSACKKEGVLRCTQCGTRYCSKECQLADWPVHKLQCKRWAKFGTGMNSSQQETLQRISTFLGFQIYLTSFLYFQYDRKKVTHGFVAVGSAEKLLKWEGEAVLPSQGNSRELTMELFTLQDLQTHFQAKSHRFFNMEASLLKEISAYDPKKEVVILFAFGCGSVSVIRCDLAYEWDVVEKTAKNLPPALQKELSSQKKTIHWDQEMLQFLENEDE